MPIAVAWEAGYGGMGGWLQKAEEADCNKMLPIAMTWEAGFGRRRWWLTLLAAAIWEAGCGDAGGWPNEAGGCLQRLQSVAANEVLLVAASGKGRSRRSAA